MVEYYELKKVTVQDEPMRISTAAILDCATCGRNIDGMGGGSTAICVRCAEIIKSGQARGAIVYSSADDVPTT